MKKALQQKYLQLIADMNQKSQLHLPAIPQLIRCFAIMMSEEEVDFLLKIQDRQLTYAQLRQLSDLDDVCYAPFIHKIFANGYLWLTEVNGQEMAELAPIFPGWIEVCLFSKEITPQKMQLLQQFTEILKLEELLNVPPIRHYWTYAKRRKLTNETSNMTISANLKREASKGPVLLQTKEKHHDQRKIIIQQPLESVETHRVSPASEIYRLLEKYGSQNKIAVVNCFCRTIRQLQGHTCQFDLPQEGCLAVGMFAKQMVDYGLGRYLALEEANALVQHCQRKGAVHTVFHYGLDTTRPEVCICNCCWDCCCLFGSYNAGGLSNITVRAHYLAVITQPEKCNGCNLCNRFCPTNATGYNCKKGGLYLQEEKCIGCGQCVIKCPLQLRHMVEAEREVYVPSLRKREIRVHDYWGAPHA